MLRLLILFLALLPALAKAEGYMVGGNLQVDDDDGLAVTLFGDVSLGEKTWLSGAIGRSGTDLSEGVDSDDSLYADIGIDHRFGLVGVRFTAAYWGDSDLLDSRDLRAAIYLSGDSGSISLDVEQRDFEFQLPPSDFLQRTRFPFDASGIGLSGSLKLSDTLTFYLSGKDYDYSVPFRGLESDRIRPLLVASRLSVLSSLIDWRVSAGIGIKAGEQRWELDVSTSKVEITDSDNDSVTLSFLTPVSDRVDIEFGLGQDRSELFGDATVASLRFFYYGGK